MVAKPAALWHSKAAARVYCPGNRLTLLGCGCSSGVEHNLAKVGVEGSNPFARSKFLRLDTWAYRHRLAWRMTAMPSGKNAVSPSTIETDLAAPSNYGLLAFLLLWLSGACLRLTVLAVPPVVPLLHADLHLSETDIGWLSSLPPMLFAVAAVPGAVLIARFGIVPALVMGLLLNAVGSAARAAFPDAISLYTSTIVMAAGVSIMQPALPPLVRAWFPQRIGFATAVYTNGLLIGETLAVSLTIPLVLPLVGDSWRLNFVVWSVPVLLTALLVVVCVSRFGGPAGVD